MKQGILSSEHKLPKLGVAGSNPVSRSKVSDRSSTWVFGYGSLMWRPAFAFAERRVGYVTGWARRFWQGSTDHRGTPQEPGRVVTLVRDPAVRTWGVAYRLNESERDAVLAELDHREKGGYARHALDVHAADTNVAPVTALVYVATADNPNYLGPAPVDQIAEQVVRSHGPSGPNLAYLLELRSMLADIGAEDPHVYEVAEYVDRLLLAGAID
jgi:glutathione-specific gamma-glutamylcyclotransferase